MKRKLVVLLTVIAILVCVALPCFAAEIDFNDYIINSSVSGDDTIVDVSIPVDVFHQIQWRLWNRTNGSWPLLVEAFGTSFTHSYSQSLDYALTVQPFGTDVLDVRDIPDGTVLTFSYSVSGVAYSGDTGLPARIGMSYYDANGRSLGYVNGSFQTGQFLEDNAVSFTLDKPNGCVSIKPALTFDSFNPIGNQTYTLTLTSVSFRFSIDSLLKLQQETGRTNKILSQIEDKIDGIIDYVPTPEDPADGLGDAFDDAEQEVIDKVESGRDEIDTIIDEFAIYLDEFLPGIVVVSNWLTVLLELKFIRVLLFFSLAFGMCGLFLGVANSFRGKR